MRLPRAIARPFPARQKILVAGVGAWFLAVAAGTVVLLGYENAPGASPAPPALWPGDSRIARATDLPTLVMFAHPRCPCTRASLGELAVLLAHCRGRVTPYVVLVKPDGLPGDWAQTDLRRSALSIPGVQVLCDDGGVEARRFHAATSGQTLLYGADGRLLFRGGITASRGHSGDNSGRSAITALVNGQAAARVESFVFGCSLAGEAWEATRQCPK